mmetsp:Transcript_22747/g.71266  ORF Transcript_22747/g.71266 Transcript_22747/m.71266 type:complete len:366 (-) Transcript_22747:133-1230(-)
MPRGKAAHDQLQLPAGHLDREAVPEPRPRLLRHHPGGHVRPRPRRREVRPGARLQVLDVRHLVDSPVDHALPRRPVPPHPPPRPHPRHDTVPQQGDARPHARARPPADRRRARRQAQAPRRQTRLHQALRATGRLHRGGRLRPEQEGLRRRLLGQNRPPRRRHPRHHLPRPRRLRRGLLPPRRPPHPAPQHPLPAGDRRRHPQVRPRRRQVPYPRGRRQPFPHHPRARQADRGPRPPQTPPTLPVPQTRELPPRDRLLMSPLSAPLARLLSNPDALLRLPGTHPTTHPPPSRAREPHRIPPVAPISRPALGPWTPDLDLTPPRAAAPRALPRDACRPPLCSAADVFFFFFFRKSRAAQREADPRE